MKITGVAAEVGDPELVSHCGKLSDVSVMQEPTGSGDEGYMSEQKLFGISNQLLGKVSARCVGSVLIVITDDVQLGM